MSDFLDVMAANSRERAEEAKLLGYYRSDVGYPVLHPLGLSDHGFDLIAETKLAGPSTGRLVPPSNDEEAVVSLASRYVDGGAAVVSVLTEPSTFQGSIHHLRAVARAVGVPVIRKDFLVDPVQVMEARAHGASGVLLIVRILGTGQLTEMIATARRVGLFVLLEVFDEDDLEVALPLTGDGVLLGVNSRDLRDLSVDRDRFSRLAPLVPSEVIAVAESGIETEQDVIDVVRLGYRLVLVGGSLSTSTHPAELVRRMVAAGRETAQVVST